MGENFVKKLKELWDKIVDKWKSFDSKQRTMVIVVFVGVVLAFIVLYAILTNPNYTVLKQCDTTKEASQITAVLDEQNIPYKVSDDGTIIKVPKKSESTARLSLAASGVADTGYTIDDALKGSFTTTESDKQKKFAKALAYELESDFVSNFTAIKRAKVILNLPENDGTLLSKQEEPGAMVTLTIDGDFTTDNAAFLARAIATAIGAKNTDRITILDSDSNMLFTGETDTVIGNASSQLGVKKEAEGLVNGDVKKVLSGTGLFGDVKVSTNLVIDFTSTETTNHQYSAPDGKDQGLLLEERRYNSDSQGSSGGVPGTDSNTETTYMYQNSDSSTATIEEIYKKYAPNEFIEHKEIPAGVVSYSQSSMAISSIDYIVIKEEDAKSQGLLEGITWQEYQAANSEKIPVPISDELIKLAADASGIPEKNISIVAYKENVFLDKEGLGIDPYDAIQVAVIVIILLLLAVVIAKSMKVEKQIEAAEELSVETLLQSNPEPQLDDIGPEETSETRRLIEKFVDENPEAVANLLRNWLNEDWG